MPNRIVREGIITSEPVNSLNWAEEVFYRRLLSVADDFGRFHGNPSLLRAACYPLQLNKVSDQDIVKWLQATEKAGLVRVYEVEGKRFVEILKFGQQIRAKDSKFPNPAKHTLSRCVADAHLDVGEVGVGDEGDRSIVGQEPDVASQKGNIQNRELRKQALEILIFLNEKTGRDYQPVPANLDLVVARLKEGASVADCRAIVAKKCREWRGDEKMDSYLRPKTLFNRTNFAQYRGELSAQPKVIA